MLEQSELLLRPWTVEPARRLAISAPNSATVLGFARRRHEGQWWSWLRRFVVEIRETEDEPLVMTLQRGRIWRGNWEVADAEETPIGRIHGTLLVSDFGDELGQWRWTKRDGKALIVRGSQSVLARAERSEKGVLLTFDPLTHSPFARMLLLAATLAHMLL